MIPSEIKSPLISAFIASKASTFSEASIVVFALAMQGAAVLHKDSPLTEEDVLNKSIILFIEGEGKMGSKDNFIFVRLPLPTLETIIAGYENGTVPKENEGLTDITFGEDALFLMMGSVDFCQAIVHYLASRGSEKVGESWGFYMIRALTGIEDGTIIWGVDDETGSKQFVQASADQVVQILAAAA